VLGRQHVLREVSNGLGTEATQETRFDAKVIHLETIALRNECHPADSVDVVLEKAMGIPKISGGRVFSHCLLQDGHEVV
jgi:hypothetical protein